jgi:hypothetical protein
LKKRKCDRCGKPAKIFEIESYKRRFHYCGDACRKMLYYKATRIKKALKIIPAMKPYLH